MDFALLYNQIRDIPYSFPTHLGDTAYNCLTKGQMLISALDAHGYKARGRIGVYDWHDTPFAKNIISLWPADILPTHFFVEADVGAGRSVRLDPSWDSGLAAAGFPITQWHGQNSMGIPRLEVFEMDAQTAYLKAWADLARVADYFSRTQPFLQAANAWLEVVRAKT